jgi:hypothetical protein
LLKLATKNPIFQSLCKDVLPHIKKLQRFLCKNELHGVIVKFIWLYTKGSMAQVLSDLILWVIEYMVNNHLIYGITKQNICNNHIIYGQQIIYQFHSKLSTKGWCNGYVDNVWANG